MAKRSACAAIILLLAATVVSVAQTKTSCLDCHSSLSDNLLISADQYAADVHVRKGLTCASCHGGDPSSDDPERAMSKGAGFRGHIGHRDVPQLCGKCHSDAGLMRQYNPSLRTDQLAQYATSVHGKRLAAGDNKVAVCTDCHGVHGIRPATDTRSPVHPLNIATTCSHCHADAAYMKPYGIPTTQFEDYSHSVHHEAMAVRGDLSAPTCTTCHGNHGAAPPGVASVENVCSTCHVFQAQLFDKSPHKSVITSGCIVCHSNHRIQKPSDEMVGNGSNAVCSQCHSEGDAGFRAAGLIRSRLDTLDTAITRSDDILGRAERSGMEVGEANIQQSQARDALTKARVAVHTASPDAVNHEIDAGAKIAVQTYDAGAKALQERNYRRKGLGVSLILIAFVVGALWMYIKEIEGDGNR